MLPGVVEVLLSVDFDISARSVDVHHPFACLDHVLRHREIPLAQLLNDRVIACIPK